MQASSGLIQDRVIYYKHADANFYSAWPFVFGRVISQLPQVFYYMTLLLKILFILPSRDSIFP